MENKITPCPQCGTQNRLGAASSQQVPVCGKCRSPLPWLVSATDSSFPNEIQAGIPVLVDFWAEWCGPCRFVAPVLEELARDQAGKLKVVKVNVDQNPGAAGRFHVQSIPTLILFKDGRPVDTLIGAMAKHALMDRLSPHLDA